MHHTGIDLLGTLICLMVIPMGWLEYKMLEKSRGGMFLGVLNIILLYGPWIVLTQVAIPDSIFAPGIVLGAAMTLTATLIFVSGIPRILSVAGQIQTRPESLVTSGPYRYMRHPLYSGHVLFIGGTVLMAGDPVLFLASPVLWFVAAVASRYEEKTRLAPCFGDKYRRYRTVTPFLMPGWGWVLWTAIYVEAIVETVRAGFLLN